MTNLTLFERITIILFFNGKNYIRKIDLVILIVLLVEVVVPMLFIGIVPTED